MYMYMYTYIQQILSAQVPSSPSSIVDGLQRHIKDLIRTIRVRDDQHERMIAGMHEQKAKIEMLMHQQAEAAQESFEVEYVAVCCSIFVAMCCSVIEVECGAVYCSV